MQTLSKEEIISIISHSRKDTLWNRLFSKKQGTNTLNEEIINKIRTYRNDVMHHHTLSEDEYKEMRSVIKQADRSIIQAINNIENKIYTETEYISVLSTMENVIPELIRAFNSLPKINIADISASIRDAFKNLSEFTKSVAIICSSDYLDSVKKTFNNSMVLTNYLKALESYQYSSKYWISALSKNLLPNEDENNQLEGKSNNVSEIKAEVKDENNE